MKYQPRPGFDADALARSIPSGSVGMSTIEGHVGAFVKFGQRFLGKKRRDAKWSHVFLVGEGDKVYQAMPGGAEIASLAEYLAETAAGDEIAFLAFARTTLEGQEAVRVAEDLAARRVGYSFWTYFYLFLKRLHAPFHRRLGRAIARTDQLICSQLVDHCLTQAGVRVFDDGRASLDVIPADFAELMNTDRATVIARFEA